MLECTQTNITQPKLKRLKRGHRDDDNVNRERGLDEIFSDDETEARPDYNHNPLRVDRNIDEFADFIEEDDPDDEEEAIRLQEEREIARPRDKTFMAGADTNGYDQDALDDMQAIFGDGEDYDWALALEDEADSRIVGDQHLELKDVFEPSQLAEKLLTDEDNQIRWADEPERFQLDRKPYKHVEITDSQFKEEAQWITSLIWPKKGDLINKKGDLYNAFLTAVRKVLEFYLIDLVEVPYVFQHRKDFLIHAKKIRNEDFDPNYPDQPEFTAVAEKLLNQDDLWRIMELDLKFRAFIDKRNTMEKTYDNLKTVTESTDQMFETMLPLAVTMEELQELQDYLQFQYAAQLADIKALEDSAKETQRRPGGRSSIHERVRKGQAYHQVSPYALTW